LTANDVFSTSGVCRRSAVVSRRRLAACPGLTIALSLDRPVDDPSLDLTVFQ
jgi:hypothetical protein